MSTYCYGKQSVWQLLSNLKTRLGSLQLRQALGSFSIEQEAQSEWQIMQTLPETDVPGGQAVTQSPIRVPIPV